MKKRYDNKLTKYIIIIPLVSLVLLATILLTVVIYNQNNHIKDDLKERKTLDIQKEKDLLSLKINQIISLIEYNQKDNYFTEEILKQRLLKRISSIRYGTKGYIYIVDGKGILKAHRNKKLINTDAFSIKDSNGVHYMKDGYNLSKKYDEAFLEYISVTNEGQNWNNRKKLTFVKYYPKWDWAISTGVYISDLDASIAIKEMKIKNEFDHQNKLLIFYSVILTLVVIILTTALAKKIASKLYSKNISLQQKIDIQTNELRANIVFLHKLLDTVPVPIFIKNNDFVFIKCNSAFCDFLELSKSEIIGKTVFDIAPKELADKYNTEDMKLLKDEKQYYKSNVITKSGDIKVVEFYKAAYYENDKFAGILGVIFDITDKEKLHDNLQKKVTDKSNQIKEEQLKNIKFTAIGQLAAGITHEINTPLTYIKGNFEMMRYDIEDLPPSDMRNQMMDDSNKITDGINRISNIVESMREMSQKSKETKEHANIYHALVTSLILIHNRAKQITKIKLNDEEFNTNMKKDKYNYISYVQKQRVEQVFIIVINNALDELVKIDDYEKREISINIANNDNSIIVTIQDNAGGIPLEIIDTIFEPFVSSKESSGIGIGLNVAKKIIFDQNGDIEAYNKNDCAVFKITLPISKEV
ncbi:MAG: cache domain-containing protein [Campylobacterota bacterium]|nr:cache domain-containing protein [Campylobacterota bacterium]